LFLYFILFASCVVWIQLKKTKITKTTVLRSKSKIDDSPSPHGYVQRILQTRIQPQHCT